MNIINTQIVKSIFNSEIIIFYIFLISLYGLKHINLANLQIINTYKIVITLFSHSSVITTIDRYASLQAEASVKYLKKSQK